MTTTTKVLKIDALEHARAHTTITAKPEILPPATTTLSKAEGGRAVLDLEHLEPSLRRKVEKWERELGAGMRGMAAGALEIGRVLAEARAELKPLGVWMAFLNRVPGMSARTGDRFIKRWEMARRMLPPAVLALAVASGTDLGGVDARKPYGRYSGAVKRIGPPPKSTGDNEKDAERARTWFGKVLVAGKRKHHAAADPVERMAGILERAARAFGDAPTVQLQFLANVLRVVTRRLEMKNAIVIRSEARRGTAKAA